MTRIVGGFIGGVIVGLIGVIITMHVMTDDITSKQAAAYDQGLRDGLEMATEDIKGEGVDIGDALNQGMAEDNERMRKQLGNVKLQLQVLQSRDDLPQPVRDELADLINGMD